jgi:amino acid transporter
MICGGGMLNSLIMSYSRLPFVLAQDGYLPKVLTRTLANGAPWVAILACSVAWALSLGLSFERLVLIDVLLYGLSLLLEFTALAVLRMRAPEMPRPFRVPGGTFIAWMLGLFPALLLGLAFWRNRTEQIAGISAIYLSEALILLGPIVYWIALKSRQSSELGTGAAD